MTKDEALKLALEALQFKNILNMCGKYSTVDAQKAAIAQSAIREALAQPEQEPVAWGVDWGKAGDIACVSIIKRLPNDVIEVVAVEYAPYSYTTPPQRKPLTDEQIADIVIEMNGNEPTAPFWRDLARAIERAHGIKE